MFWQVGKIAIVDVEVKIVSVFIKCHHFLLRELVGFVKESTTNVSLFICRSINIRMLLEVDLDIFVCFQKIFEFNKIY